MRLRAGKSAATSSSGASTSAAAALAPTNEAKVTPPAQDETTDDLLHDAFAPAQAAAAQQRTEQVVLSFWLVVVLALPFWWLATSIERAALDSPGANSWSAHLPCALRPRVSLAFLTSTGALDRRAGTSALALIPRDLQALPSDAPERCIALNVGPQELLANKDGRDKYVLRRRADDADDDMGQQQQSELEHGEMIYTGDPLAAARALLGLPSSAAATSPPTSSSSSSSSSMMPFSPRYTVIFSLLFQDSTAATTSAGGVQSIIDLHWRSSSTSPAGEERSSLLSKHITPLLRDLEQVHSFDVRSDVRYFAPLAFEPTRKSGGEGGGEMVVIEEEQLKAFVNDADWNLDTSLELDPVMHFVLYVPAAHSSPMRIMSKDGKLSRSNAFMRPQWGGVVIADNADALDSRSFDRAFKLFSKQLRELLGVPKSPSSSVAGRGGVSFVESQAAPDEDIATSGEEAERKTPSVLQRWQVDVIVRRRLIESAREATSTLQAVVRLVGESSNMPVKKHVQRDVRIALDQLEQARDALECCSTPQALSHASAALEAASRAYFDPSMLSLLYFPDEHKYAVYTPLFGPVAVPLVVSVIKLFKERRRRRQQADKASKSR